MHEIRFRSVEASGFKAYRAPMVFNLAPTPGLHFLCGDNRAEPTLESNGAGKSSVWDLFCWIIKGRTLEGLRGPDLQSWGSDGTVKGKLVFACDDEERSVVRTANPNSLELDGDPVGQDAIDRLFGNLSLEAIGHTIIHGQGREFFFDLAPAKKMELLAETLNLERWEARSLFVSQRVKRIEDRITKLRAGREGLEGRRQEIARLSDEAKQAQVQWSEDLKATLKRIDGELKQEDEAVSRIQKRRDTAKLANDGAGTEAAALEREITQLEVYWQDTTRQLADKGGEERAAVIRLEEARSALQLIRDHRNCPTCSQVIDRRKLLPTAQDKVRETHEAVDNLRGERKVLAGSETDLKQQLDEARANLRRFRQREAESQTTLNNLEPDLAARQTRIRTLRAQKKAESEAPNPYVEEVKQYRLRLGELVNKVKVIDVDIQRYTALGERTRWWVKGFRDVRLYIIQEALMQMQLLANSMLEESGLVGWSLDYVSERTTKSDTLKTGIAILVKPAAIDQPIRWESFSGGERQRLRLIGSRAFAEVLLNNAGLWVNLEVFDEPTAALSPRGIADLVELLAEQARWSRKSIFVVDHHVIESDRFASVVRVVRDEHGSRIDGTV